MTARARRRGAVIVVATVATLAGVVQASAPPWQYQPFDRTDSCIVDTQTKLTWMRATAPSPAPAQGFQSYSFSDATTQCGRLGPGWRVPTVNELQTLVDEVPHVELDQGQLAPKAIDANAFPGAPVASPYWTSQGVAGDPLHAWAVDFHDGSSLTESRTVPLYVRCVTATAACPVAPEGGTP
jgi:hypothetical protein